MPVIDAGSSAVRSRRVHHRPAYTGLADDRAAGSLVRTDVPRRLRPVRRAGQAASATEPAVVLASARRRRHALLWRVRCDPRRAFGLRSVLQAALLPRPSTRDIRVVARGHELPRRVSRRARRAVALRTPPPQALAR